MKKKLIFFCNEQIFELIFKFRILSFCKKSLFLKYMFLKQQMHEVKFLLHWDITNKLIVSNGSNNHTVTSAEYSLGTGVPLRHLVFLHNVIFSSGPYTSVRWSLIADYLDEKL